MTAPFTPRLKLDNRDPRVACVLLLDVSLSMGGTPIDELNRGYAQFCGELGEDPLARKRTEVAVVTFGGEVRVAQPFAEARELAPQRFSVSGTTPLGEALDTAMDLVEGRKAEYRAAGLEYYRPWLFVLSDGSPTDGDRFERAVQRLSDMEKAKGATVFAVGIGDTADMTQLARLSQRGPARLRGLQFGPMFAWLSASMQQVSNSVAFGPESDTTQIPLPPVGWGTA
ncbi:VWA domain-containing protein [Actinomadura nitritigenes]|uniref:VWA domain-containing protein n=1 Tax=Actinomadura nitritigenes TaxID=134602 RepID=A0ABS3R6K3_9ACTN|nr:VWA domain-containing protein [Actinomadura nitritigenes]MBO2441869.1 VWA domain-containing protein [Actinomadura nitritigenes]